MAAPLPEPETVSVTELNQQTTAVLRRVKAGHSLRITERGKVIGFLTPPPPSVTGNTVVDGWITEGRITQQAVPGSVLDLLPIPASDDDVRLSDVVVAEREREAGE